MILMINDCGKRSTSTVTAVLFIFTLRSSLLTLLKIKRERVGTPKTFLRSGYCTYRESATRFAK